MLKPVALAEMPMDPAEATSVHDMSRTTRTRKCGNPSSEPRPVVAKATGKQPVVKAGATKAGAAKAGPAGSR